jgi:hypothetical protein
MPPPYVSADHGSFPIAWYRWASVAQIIKNGVVCNNCNTLGRFGAAIESANTAWMNEMVSTNS